MTATLDPPFDLSRAADRAELITVLIGLGVPAVLHLSLPWPVVYIPLVNESEDEAFGIEAFEGHCPGLVGVEGHRPAPEDMDSFLDAYSLDDYGGYTLADLVAQVAMLWESREKMVAAFHAGHFDDGGLMEDVLIGGGGAAALEEAAE